MDVAAFDFALPAELIAQEPPAERGTSRLMIVPRDGRAFVHTTMAHVGEWLRPGDLLVVNNTRVFPARLLGVRVPSGGAVECLLVRRLPADEPGAEGAPHDGAGREPLPPEAPGQVWEALVHPGQKLKPGARMRFAGEGVVLEGEILARRFFGRRTVRLWVADGTSVDAAIDAIGHMPLPPYIRRADRPSDRERYQTVYATRRGSIAAPTAGLHFTEAILADLRQHGIERAEVTLHVGYGTFKPVRVDTVEAHTVDPEVFDVGEAAAAALARARREHRRIVAVGTTTVRALESLAIGEDGSIGPQRGETHAFIYPGHVFRLVDALLTNFHLPRSSLLMLVAALAGRDRILAAYAEAVRERYRFYSYGDAMLVI